MATMTLDAREVLMEGWLTVYKSRNATFFSKLKPDKALERTWAVIHGQSAKGPILSFYQDQHKDNRVLRREKVELMTVRAITRMLQHPKHPHCFTLKLKGRRNRLLFNCDTSADATRWLNIITSLVRIDFRLERVMWEFLDGQGLWQALSDNDSFQLETNHCEQHLQFLLGEPPFQFQYNLSSMNRLLAKSKHPERIRRTPFMWEKPESLHQKMNDLPAIWEWGDPAKDEWHPFERETNIQIEEMYDSGSQWAELTLVLPSPMLFLLNLQDMKLVNSSTQVRYCLRRVDNSANMASQAPLAQDPRSPSPDEDEAPDDGVVSPVSPLFQPLQQCLRHLQVNPKNITFKHMIGEGAFGDVHLAEIVGLPNNDPNKVFSVAVKQLRLSDFIARHGHHSQQTEDFLREAKEMAKVNHNRVVKLLGVSTLSYPMMLIEEYMNMGDLLEVLKDSRPSMELAQQLSYAWQIADGMDYLANDLQCVHRDLAARNVMVHKQDDDYIVAKIADFGLSRHLYTEMYKHQGNKPRPLPAKWMALESLMYFVFTTRSDIWSFGVVLWEIMTLGRSPYPGVENRELLEQIEEHGLKLSRPKTCPGVIYDIILDCTTHEPDERPGFGDLRTKLQALYDEAQAGKLTSTDETTADKAESAEKEAKALESTSEKATDEQQQDKTSDKNESGQDVPAKGDDSNDKAGQAEADPNVGASRSDSGSKIRTVAVETSEATPTSVSRESCSSASATVERPSNTEVSKLGHVYYTIDMGGDFDETWAQSTNGSGSKSDAAQAGDNSAGKVSPGDVSGRAPLPVNGAVPGKRTA